MDFEKGTYIISPERVDKVIEDLKECLKEGANIQLTRDIKQLKKDKNNTLWERLVDLSHFLLYTNKCKIN